MDLKKLAVKGTMIASAAAVIGGIAILNYDKHSFYQEDLENAYHKAWLAKQNLKAEFEHIHTVAYEETKKYPEYKLMDSLSYIHEQNPEYNYYLERKIDSLWYAVDSIRNDIEEKHIENSETLEHAYQKLDNAYNKIDALKQDSIINDSINNQPLGQRFKNNWNKIFCQQKLK